MLSLKKIPGNKTCFILLVAAGVFYACDNAGTDFPDPPEITSINPTTGPIGTSVTVNGNGFGPSASENVVRFSGVRAEINSATENTIETSVPPGTSSGAVEVVVNGLIAVGPNFTVNEEMPGITAVEPDSATVGNQITINGMNFSAVSNENIITFNGGIIADVIQASETELVTIVPEGARSGPILVEVNNQTTTSPMFTVIPAPKLIFASTRTGDFDVWQIRTDGTNLKNLTNEPGLDIAVEYSPDGTQIIFRSDRDGTSDIWTMNADGNGATKLAGLTASSLETTPSWSPAGTQIAYASDALGDYEIWVMGSDGSNHINLTNDPGLDINPFWSPDGSMIAFESERSGNRDIWVMGSDGSNPTNLTENSGVDFGHHWSPDGTKISFVSDRSGNYEIWVVDADGSNLTNLTNDPNSDLGPQWSPDGSMIAFESNRNSIYEEIWVMAADGSNPINLSNGHGARPRWSPDGSMIAFQSFRTGDTEIWVVTADGSEEFQVTDRPNADDINVLWMPN